ncbi:MAG: 16S rRNA (guanine(527)-N(7))-methyltransferase RsmG [Synechococcus sp. SB0662_bin_45]|uniref:Ribosomal RNA small subunit methyltransferase G n=1 Tax=Synechococcus sp. SB0676_bin_10 TaxID=2604869 RepID=A0A6B1F9N4_9SYNE|nr:16S rRNA (guanine(527)-N(7))-methyltransferase RsmG [Cyanobacteria bacterium MAG IRC3_bin_20]MXW11593.1 16S rRNA (guanine(527)-N(7))-methyltransferase RsmG [Synechococcus sp. SB0668_bin_13]MXY18672.1 16S rRNA (guanine(527)-N(7))-methyltransferase RsmG [Synechococcus sp. SB0664_bin_36]MYE21149.1 16S rRNA (guanine(527)-N(7))-methyltransferase RsmG [Synechococcus sp. SB0662_bin_45]MYG38445.1 16S rRNA (guanine(527)-N(7))-methyltransferase RsmG [Synechococcus sp. SB0676_bin_10]MYK07312.1 16S rRN
MELIPLSPAQHQALAVLQRQLRQWNSHCNLTRLVDGDDYWVAQVQDSLWPLSRMNPPFRGPLRGVDVGTGGGIPGLVLAIALPESRWVLVDSVQRKCAAVQAMASGLGLQARVEVVCERAESLGRDAQYRGRFDVAVARGVAPAPVAAEYLAPLLGSGGLALLYRGRWSTADHRALQQAARQLGCRIRASEHCLLPANRGQRHVLILEAEMPCPAPYPRAVGVPARRPLATASSSSPPTPDMALRGTRRHNPSVALCCNYPGGFGPYSFAWS